MNNQTIRSAVKLYLTDQHAAEEQYGPINTWDVSSVTDMSFLFYDAISFNGDLSSWDVSSVTNMSYMFSSASSFNGDLSKWDVSSVTDMSCIHSFN